MNPELLIDQLSNASVNGTLCRSAAEELKALREGLRRIRDDGLSGQECSEMAFALLLDARNGLDFVEAIQANWASANQP